MKTLRILLLFCILQPFIPVAVSAQSAANKFIVRSDPRVELMSIVFMLAGSEEYNMATPSPYKEDVQRYFAKYKDHDVVKLAKEYRSNWGVSYDAVMSMAVHIKDIDKLEEKIPFSGNPEKFDKRWNAERGRKFLQALRKFAAETNFKKFIDDHRELYSTSDLKLEELIKNSAKLEWFDSFFGKRENGQFILVPGYLTGGGNYGVGFKDMKNGIDEMYSITSFGSVDAGGIPNFNRNIISTVIHEFSHSYVNPVFEKHQAELKEAGEKIFPFVADKMKSQAYGGWQTMMIESGVRACVNRYLKTNSGESARLNDITYNTSRGFIWIEDLAKIFDEYENNRKEYAGLDEFFPNIVKFFNDYSKIIKDVIEKADSLKEAKQKEMKEKGPKVLSTIPAIGDTLADPETQYLVITFDREMAPNSWSINLGTKSFPAIEGKPFYENENKVLKLKVKLKPDTEYEFWLNSESTLGFRSKDNIPLFPVQVKFKTK
jgi:hypothetical protein